MKKSFVLFIVLVVLAVSLIAFGQSSILAEKDNVIITENILYGDKSVVEGVTLNLHNHYETQIFWDTTYVIGEQPVTETEYTFYQSKQNYRLHKWNGGLYFNDDMHAIGWDKETLHAPEGLEVAIQELYDATGASEVKEKTVFLKDYIDYYNFSVSFQTSHVPYANGGSEPYLAYDLSETSLLNDLQYADAQEGKNNSYSKELTASLRKQLEWIETFQDFFKIPVLENDVYLLSMEKDANENIIGWAMSSANGGMGSGEIDIPELTDRENYDSFQYYVSSFVGDGDVYMTFHSRSYNGVVVDTSQIPGGYGIYHFPYDLEKNEIYPEQLQMVYALDPNLNVQDLTRDARGENLLLFTMEDAELYMSVIDIDTMTLVDKFSLSETREDAWGLDYYALEEDYMVVLTYGDVIVFTIDENGNYTKAFEVSREPLNGFLSEENRYYYETLQYGTAYAWNGEQLVFANNMYNVNGYTGTNFYVGAIDKNGLQYFATYDTSLQSSISKDEDGYENYNYHHCLPMDYEPILISWE